MPDSKHLALFIDAPMQSWGYQSKFERRTSLSYPTKSGILGLVCAAMGIPKTDTDGLAKLANLKMSVYSFKKGKCQPLRLIDYHTVGGGYEKYDEKTQKENIVKTADGKTRGTVQTYREFLLDAKFAVILSGEKDSLGKIHNALSNPKWGVWFGRGSHASLLRL
jgi:CRISPR system Cascade subunit CasD